jgi:ABC-type multidrug transport system permease subunit
MSRSAVLIGRTVADAAVNVITITVMAITGLAVGWRINSSFGEAVGGFLLLLVFAFSISWLMALVGLIVRTPEVVNNASFIVIFPLTFISNAFVPLETFPSVLQTFAEWNPVSTVVQGARELFGNIPAGYPEPEAWSLANPVLYTVLWAVVFLAVFVPLSVRAYKRAAGR